jgi:hypothetical protein
MVFLLSVIEIPFAAMLRVNSPQCAFEVLCHALERQIERRPAANKHIIMSRARPGCGPEPNNFTEAAADSVALDSIPDSFRYREAETSRPLVAAIARLQHECCRRRLDP